MPSDGPGRDPDSCSVRFRMRFVSRENRRRQFHVGFVDEETRAAREVERIGAAGVVGEKPRLDSRR